MRYPTYHSLWEEWEYNKDHCILCGIETLHGHMLCTPHSNDFGRFWNESRDDSENEPLLGKYGNARESLVVFLNSKYKTLADSPWIFSEPLT